MTITELLPTLGIAHEDIIRTFGNMDQEIIPSEYNSIEVYNIRLSYFDNDSQCIKIEPAIKWTDGGCRPAYGSLEYGVHIHLNKRMFKEGRRLHQI